MNWLFQAWTQDKEEGSNKPLGQACNLGKLLTQMMYKSCLPWTGNLGKGKNLLAKGDNSSGKGHWKPPKSAEGSHPSSSMSWSG